jgi:prepilin-type N-terminal cleavage/methylation domain-containing protein
MKRFLKHFRYGQKGFTLIELLVVIGILGAIAAVVVPNVGSFIGRGKTEAQATELHNIQTSVMAMLVDSDNGELDAAIPIDTPTNDMSTVTASKTDTSTTPPTDVTLILSDYLTGLDPDNTVKTGCTYAFELDGTVTQILP